MKKILFILFIILSFLEYWKGTSISQPSSLSVDIKKAKLSWTWNQGTSGMADYFQARCIRVGTSEIILGPKTLPAAREQSILSIIQVSAEYICAVKAGNTFGESGYSNEVTFNAGDIPNTPTDLEIKID